MRTISVTAPPSVLRASGTGTRITHVRSRGRRLDVGTPSCGHTLVAQLLHDHQRALEQILQQHRQSLQGLLANQSKDLGRPLFTAEEAEPLKSDKDLHIAHVQNQWSDVGRPLLSLSRHTSGVSSDETDTDLSPLSPRSPRSPRHGGAFFACKAFVHEKLLPFVKSWLFQGIMSAIVMGNAAFLAVGTHYKVLAELQGNCLPQAQQNIFEAFKWIFFLAFVFEMVIRLLAERAEFCRGENKWWNLFEMLCLVSMALEMLHLEDSAEMVGNMTVLRMLRMLRVLRAARALRLFQFFKQLRLMLYSVVSCLVSMMWALVLIFMSATLAALYLEDAALGYLHDIHRADHSNPCSSSNGTVQEGPAWQDDPVRQSLEENWGGMFVAVRSLIYAISGGADWGDLAAPFWHIGMFPGVLFVVYILVSTLGLLNVLVGIFVQEAGEISQWDKDLMVDGIIEKREKRSREITALFESIDLEKTGWLSLEELSTSLENTRISAFFEHLDVDVSKVEVLFKLLDLDGNGKITKEEFVTGIGKLHAKGNPEDVAVMLLEEQRLHAKIDELRALMCQHYNTLIQSR